MDKPTTTATWAVVGLVVLALVVSQHETLATWAAQPSSLTVFEALSGKLFSLVVGWALSSLLFAFKARLWPPKTGVNGAVSSEPAEAPSSAPTAPPRASRLDGFARADLTELLGAIGARLDSQTPRKKPFSELDDAAGAVLLLVLCSAPAAAYRMSYVLPYDRFKVAVLDSLERCLQFLDDLPYLPDCMVVEEDDLAGGTDAANGAITAIRRRLGPAELPILRVVRNANQRSSSTLASARPYPAAWTLPGDTLVAPFHSEDLAARIMAQVTLRSQHQQRAAAHATRSVLRYLLPAPAFSDLTHGSPWATRVHSDVSFLTAALVDPHATAAVALVAPAMQSPVSLMSALHDAHASFDGLCEMHGVTKMAGTGDEYVAVGGLDDSPDHLARLMRVAAGMVAELQQQQMHIQVQAGVPALEVQIGLHAGPCVTGVVGRARPTYTLMGEVVATASHLRNTSHPMCIHVSSAVRDRLQPSAASRGGGGGNGEFAFIAATPHAVIGGPSGLGPARTYYAKLGYWRSALTAHGAPSSTVASRGLGPVPGHRPLRRATHSTRALMAAAAASGAAAAAAAAAGGQGSGAHQLPARALSTSSIEVSGQQQERREANAAAARPGSGQPDAAAASRQGAAGGEGAAGTFSGSGGAWGITGYRTPPSPPSGAAAAVAEYGAVAAAVAPHHPYPGHGGPRRAPPARAFSNLSSATSLFAPSTINSGGGSATHWPTHGSSGVFGAGTGSSILTQAQSSESSLYRISGMDHQQFHVGASSSYRGASSATNLWGTGGNGGSQQQQPQGQQQLHAQGSGAGSFMMSLQQQQQLPYGPGAAHGMHGGQSSALPTVDEDLGGGPGGVSGSLGGFTAALYNLSNGILSNAQLHSSIVAAGRSFGNASTLEHPPWLAGAPGAMPPFKGGRAQALRYSESSAMPPGSGAGALAAGGTASGPGGTGEHLAVDKYGSPTAPPHEGMVLVRTSTMGIDHNPYMVYTNISDMLGGGSNVGLGLRVSASGAVSGPVAAADTGASYAGGAARAIVSSAADTNGTPSDPATHGITHSELMFLLATSSVGVRGAGAGGKESLLTSYEDERVASGANAPAYAALLAEGRAVGTGSCGGGSGAATAASTATAAATAAAAKTAAVPTSASDAGGNILTAASGIDRGGLGRSGTADASPERWNEPSNPALHRGSLGNAAAGSSAGDQLLGKRFMAGVSTGGSSRKIPKLPGTKARAEAGEGSAAESQPLSPVSAAFAAAFGPHAASAKPPSIPASNLAAARLLLGRSHSASAGTSGSGASAAAGAPMHRLPAQGPPDSVKARSSGDGTVVSGMLLPNGASMSASDLAMLLQVAQRSVGGGNSGSSISFPHLQELVSATLRDGATGRTLGSSMSHNSFNLHGQLQLLPASNDNGAASSSQECSDTETAIQRGGPYTAPRRRSVDVQRKLATAAAAGAAASFAVGGAGGSGVAAGSLGSGSAGTQHAMHRLSRTLQQLYYQQQQQLQQQQQQQRQQQSLQQQQGGAISANADLQPWVFNGATGSGTRATTDSRKPQPLRAAGVESGECQSGASGGDEGLLMPIREAGGSRDGDDGHLPPGVFTSGTGGSRARPAAGQFGIASTLSTVADLPTPPSSSCLTNSRSRDNSRNPLLPQRLPSNHSGYTGTTGALSFLGYQAQTEQTPPSEVLTPAGGSGADNGGPMGQPQNRQQHHQEYYYHTHALYEGRLPSFPLAREDGNSPLMVLLAPHRASFETTGHVSGGGGGTANAGGGQGQGVSIAAAAEAADMVGAWVAGTTRRHGGGAGSMPRSAAAAASLAAAAATAAPKRPEAAHSKQLGGSPAAAGDISSPHTLMSSLGADGVSFGGDGITHRTDCSSAAPASTSTLFMSTHQSLGGAGAVHSGSHAAGAERQGSDAWSGSAAGLDRSTNRASGSTVGSAQQSVRRSAASAAVAFFRKRSKPSRHQSQTQSLHAHEAAGELAAAGPWRVSSSGLSGDAASPGDNPNDVSAVRRGAGGSSGGGLAGMLRTLSFGKPNKRGNSKGHKS